MNLGLEILNRQEFDTKFTEAIINPLRFALFELRVYSARDDS